MNVELIAAAREHANILARLWPLYQYDMSEVGGAPINAYGLFEDAAIRDHDYRVDLETWWHNPDAVRPFLIQVDGRAAGFAVVGTSPPYASRDRDFSIVEFFVLRGFRRRGVAREATSQLFGRFPGRWELSVYLDNAPALAFWQSVLKNVKFGDVVEQAAGSEPGLFDMVRFEFDIAAKA